MKIMNSQSNIDEENKIAASRRRFMCMAAAAGSSALLTTSGSASAQTYAGTAGFFFNVKDYGAAGNGTTDDTAAIQSAINAAMAVGGGVVLFPVGQYLVPGTLTIDSNTTTAHVALQGVTPGPIQDGPIYQGGSTILVPSNSTSTTILATYVDGVSIRSLTISSPSPRSGGTAIYLNGTTNPVLEDVHLKNQKIGIYIYAGYGHRINRGHWIIPSDGIGLWVDGDTVGNNGLNNSNDTYINLISTYGGWAAFRLTNTGGTWMHQCDSINSSTGLLIDPGQNQEVLWCFFESCAFDTASNSNIHAVTQGGKIRGINFSNCWSASTSGPGNGCCLIAGDVDGVQFVGHRFFNNAVGNGLWASGVKNIYVDASVAAGFTNGAGFSFNSCTDFAVRDCRIGPYAAMLGNKTGIYIGAGCTRYVISGCSIVGNTTNVTDSGSAPKSFLSGANLIA